LAAAFAIAGAGIYTSNFHSTSGPSFARFIVVFGIGAGSALLGFGMGTCIDKAAK